MATPTFVTEALHLVAVIYIQPWGGHAHIPMPWTKEFQKARPTPDLISYHTVQKFDGGKP